MILGSTWHHWNLEWARTWKKRWLMALEYFQNLRLGARTGVNYYLEGSPGTRLRLQIVTFRCGGHWLCVLAATCPESKRAYGPYDPGNHLALHVAIQQSIARMLIHCHWQKCGNGWKEFQ